jgi:16S rRNA C1402 N4-methylase RsmH
MTDDELKEYIVRYQQAVHDCERSLDYSRITLGNALFEAGHREIAKVTRTTGEVVFISRKPTVVKRARSAKPALDENALADFITKNLSPEQLAKFLSKKKGA